MKGPRRRRHGPSSKGLSGLAAEAESPVGGGHVHLRRGRGRRGLPIICGRRCECCGRQRKQHRKAGIAEPVAGGPPKKPPFPPPGETPPPLFSRPLATPKNP